METVNWYMLNDILNPIGGTADIDEDIFRYRNVNGNVEDVVKGIITKEIKPYYGDAPNSYKESLKRSLAYFLTTERIDFGRLYDSCLIAFDHPENPKLFFRWIWDVLFPGENYHIEKIEMYVEVEDINEPRNYFI